MSSIQCAAQRDNKLNYCVIWNSRSSQLHLYFRPRSCHMTTLTQFLQTVAARQGTFRFSRVPTRINQACSQLWIGVRGTTRFHRSSPPEEGGSSLLPSPTSRMESFDLPCESKIRNLQIQDSRLLYHILLGCRFLLSREG